MKTSAESVWVFFQHSTRSKLKIIDRALFSLETDSHFHDFLADSLL